MKKTFIYFSSLLLSASLSSAVYAQTETTPIDQKTVHRLVDPTMKEQISNDWNERNLLLANQPVEWYDSKDGYYGIYSTDSSRYMTRYDKDGKYIETMTKREWSSAVPEVRTSFDQSNYRTQQVTSYWEVSDPNKKGYYLELSDERGRVTKLWSDKDGHFTTDPEN